jgi:membrane peptidoglycan carboxypeptidase
MSDKNDYQFEYLKKYENQNKRPQSKKRTNRNKQRKGCVRFLILLIQLGVIGLLLAVVAFIGGYIYLSDQLSDSIAQVVAYQGTGVGGTPRFFDRNGELLFELRTVEKRRWLAYEEIPVDVLNATISVEDDTFWTNPGFDPTAIGAAVFRNYQNQDGRPVGASTITQQLVRHIAFSYEERVGVSYERKLKEIFLSFIMTQQRSKQEILQMYLNEIYYGNLAYGIEAAAQLYFGKAAVDLSLPEAAFLVGLPQSPIDWDPYTNFEGAKARQALILELMYADGAIDYTQAQVAKGVTLVLAPRISAVSGEGALVLKAPHFVLFVQDELEGRFGADAILRGGWQITTSLDLSIHELAETAVREQVAARAAEHDVSNGSVVVLKPATGEILGMVGSLDYFNDAISGQVNVALSPRQPGSSIKPITYVAAMERGWTTADVLWDVPIQLDLGDGEIMMPVNYDGRYHGPILFRDALANSYNIPPIQLLRDISGTYFVNVAHKMGIDSLKEPAGFYGLALTLGGGEVPLLEMTRAFATLANLGQKPHLTSILKITDSRGNVIFDDQENRLPAVNAIDPRIAYIITDILDDDQARIPAMGRGSALELPFPAAVKTGTTNDFRDNWTIGYTPGLVVGVWMGNSDGHPMHDSSGLRGSAPVWQRIMEAVYADDVMMNSLFINGALPFTDFIQPQGIELRNVCLPQGTGGVTCTSTRPDYFLTGTAVHNIPRIGYRPNPHDNPGAWTISTLAIAAEDAQRYVDAQPALLDGTTAVRPDRCVVTSGNPPAQTQTRLYLPIPPHYPDEVRARIWARGTGFQMAPPTVCTRASLQAEPVQPVQPQDTPTDNNG